MFTIRLFYILRKQYEYFSHWLDGRERIGMAMHKKWARFLLPTATRAQRLNINAKNVDLETSKTMRRWFNFAKQWHCLCAGWSWSATCVRYGRWLNKAVSKLGDPLRIAHSPKGQKACKDFMIKHHIPPPNAKLLAMLNKRLLMWNPKAHRLSSKPMV